MLVNKVGMSQLLLRRYKDARKSFERAIRLDKKYANAYANLGVVITRMEKLREGR